MDDKNKLKKALKRREQAKKKSAKKWGKIERDIAETKSEQQHKREANLKSRSNNGYPIPGAAEDKASSSSKGGSGKKSGGKGKGGNKSSGKGKGGGKGGGGKSNSAGFEGKKDGFLNKAKAWVGIIISSSAYLMKPGEVYSNSSLSSYLLFVTS